MKIVHQFNPALAAASASAVPPGAIFEALPPAAPWEVPPDARVLLVGSGAVSAPDRAPEGWPRGLQWVHLRSTGIDNMPGWLLDVPAVTVSRGAQATAISEYVLAAMLAFEKRLPEIWIGPGSGWPKFDLGRLDGRVLGIVGMGSIGAATARRARAFDMNILGLRRSAGTMPEGVTAATLDEILARADHLLLSAPLTPETDGMIGAETFARMKRSMHLINVARGRLIRTEALEAALDSGIVACASLDVTDPEPLPEGHWMRTHPRAHVTAHLAAQAPGTEQRVHDILAHNLAVWVAGRPGDLIGQVRRGGSY